MKIKIILPNATLLDEQADKITAPGADGFFQILPKHIDFVSSLNPGILSVYSNEQVEYYAVNQGFLVKQKDVVYISCLQAVKGTSLETLSRTVSENFKQLGEKEKKTNEILIKLEADMLRMFMEID